MNKADLLSAMRAGHTRLEKLFDNLSEEQMLAPRLHGGWSGKDLLAHLGFWEQRMAAYCQMLLNGETPMETVGQFAVDEINAATFAEHHDQALDGVRRFERQSFQRLLALAEQASQADLLDPQRFAWLKGATLGAWIEGNSYGHYEEHQADLAIFED
ncbi:MAG: ClbS/DfsB family four-helix bundle protein [Anaerolineaceae bacterium]|jgi:hypothetical protein